MNALCLRVIAAAALALSSAVAAAGDLPVLIFAGQSIAINSGTDSGTLPRKLLLPQTNVWFYNARHHFLATGSVHWVIYQAPTGPGFPADSIYPNPSGSFGPEIATAGEISRRVFQGRPVAVFKYAVGATDLAEQWSATHPGPLYQEMMVRLKQALAALPEERGLTGRVAGIFWTQGESDAIDGTESAREYGDHLRSFITSLRRQLGQPELPFVYARISPQWPNAELVRNGQERAAREVPRVAMVNADDLLTRTRHYDNAGTLALGRRYAEAFETIVSHGPTVPSDSLLR